MTNRSDWPTKKMTLAEAREDSLSEDLSLTTTPEERWEMMWQLAVNAWTFRGEPVDQRLSRHVVRVIRRKG